MESRRSFIWLLPLLVMAAFLLLPGCPGELLPGGGTSQDSGPLPAHCTDGLYNMGEEGLDCGWSCPNECVFTEKSGVLLWSESWSGNVHVSSFVFVPGWVTLTIEPGTIVKFKHDRDYKSFERGGIGVEGTIIAAGTPQRQIWFTSDAPDPINGDWSGIGLSNSHGSRFDYAIMEFGEMGIEQFDSDATVSNSIVRWCNAEGLYAERSTPVFENNTLYSNGYHEIALEQYNEVIIRNNYFHDGVCGVHNEKTVSLISDNYFDNYKWPAVTAGMDSELKILNNVFLNVPHSPPYLIYGGATAQISGNLVWNPPPNNATLSMDEPSPNSTLPSNDSPSLPAPFPPSSIPPPPQFAYEDIRNFEIDYLPGDENDRFPYIYDSEDETRKVLKRIGEGLRFGWALAYAEGSLYRFSLGSTEKGESLDFIMLNPDTGEYEKFGNDWIMNPRGLAWDGEYFWVNDFSLLKIYKFRMRGGYIELLDSFDIPEKERGGTSGLATDGEYLYLRKRDGTGLYIIDKAGNLRGEISMGGGNLGSGLVWTGEHFWAVGGCKKGICKFTREGELVGEIYPAAKDTWALAWDGSHLWSIQRTSEMWDDPKIYEIEILDDSLGPQ